MFFSNPHTHSWSLTERKDSTHYTSVVVRFSNVKKAADKKHSMSPSCWRGVVQASGRIGRPVRLNTAKLTPCFFGSLHYFATFAAPLPLWFLPSFAILLQRLNDSLSAAAQLHFSFCTVSRVP